MERSSGKRPARAAGTAPKRPRRTHGLTGPLQAGAYLDLLCPRGRVAADTGDRTAVTRDAGASEGTVGLGSSASSPSPSSAPSSALFSQLQTKIARARTQDVPVLYAHILPGLDVLICAVRAAQPPYPNSQTARAFCLEAMADALEQPLNGLESGGYWYETNGLGFLVFASMARERILQEFGATHILDRGETAARLSR